MLMFTLAISYLTTSNLPWFMDLTFQVPMQYCSLQHQSLLPSPDTSTTWCYFCFGSVSSFFLELFLHWSPVTCWAPTNLGSLSFSVLSFFLFILFMGFSRQEYWSGLPFPSPVDHLFSELHHNLCFIELDKAVVHVIRLVSSVIVVPICLPSDALSQSLLSYWGFCDLGCEVSPLDCSPLQHRRSQCSLLQRHTPYK